MFQLQYYNSSLKNNHINKILNNYQIKYTQIKNEIESKVNQMIKFFLKDISVYLQNIEEIAEQKKKINEYDSVIKELELTRAKIKDKIENELKLKNEYDNLQQENYLLKLKIKSLKYKIKNLINISGYNSQGVSPKRKQSNNSIEKHAKLKKNYMSPPINYSRNLYTSCNTSCIENDFNKSTMSFNSPNSSELNTTIKNRNIIDKLTLKLNYDKMVKSKNKIKKKKKKEKINKYVNNKAIIKKFYVDKNKNDSLKKYHKNRNIENTTNNSKPHINKLIHIKKKKNVNLSAEKIDSNLIVNKNKYSPVNTTNQSIEVPLINVDYENLEKNIVNVIDKELKEIEQDQANIQLLLEQLNEYNDNN